jgi:hypothetical protein
MKPMFSARKRVRVRSDISLMCSPAMSTSPEVMSSSPETLFKSVVLPHPEGPIMATIPPLRTARLTPLRASNSTLPLL